MELRNKKDFISSQLSQSMVVVDPSADDCLFCKNAFKQLNESDT
jgi:hypothetical protein